MYYLNESVEKLDRIFDQNLREGYLRLDLNENPGGLSDEFIKRVLADITPEFVSKYPETLPFTEALGKFLGVNIDELCLTNGSAEGIRHIIEAYSQPNGKILCVHPSYAMFEVYAKMYGRKFVPVEYDGAKINVETFISKITEDIDIVVVLNPNNPMGDVFTYEEMDRIVEAAQKANATVLIDEAYFYFYKNTFIKYALENDFVFVTRTFSKLFSLAGLRLGYVVGRKDGIKNIQKLCTPHNVNAFALKFAQEIIETEGMIDALVEKQLEGKSYLAKTLVEKGYQINAQEGNFVFIKTKTDAPTVKDRLKEEKRILVKTYSGIQDLGECLRVSTGEKSIMETFITALEEVDQ